MNNESVCNTIQSFTNKFLPFLKKNNFILIFTDIKGRILFSNKCPQNQDQISILSDKIIPSIFKDSLLQKPDHAQQIRHGKIGNPNQSDHLIHWYYTVRMIHHNKGEPLGFLFILTEKKELEIFLTSLAHSFANIIEEDMANKALQFNLNISKDFLRIISKSSTDGILYLDKHAKIRYMNEMAGDILHVNPQKSINQYVGDIVDFEPVVLSVFKTKKGYTDQEFIIHSPNRGTLHFIKTAIIVKDEDGQFAGVVDFFREISRVRRFVTSYIGAQAKFNFNDIIGNDKQLRESIRISMLAARSTSNVLILGETGTGKEMIAQAIHYEGKRKDGPFVIINCGAIPRDLAESEFFGYEPGSFTGADKKGRSGKFELANGGTIFLDEIGELPLSLQTKLLRVIQERKITRIGGIKQIPVNVRVIVASNKDLQVEVQQGRFRNDLYYRINVIRIHLPSLKDRKDDISQLVQHFNEKLSIKLEREIPQISSSFMNPLLRYEFPGNVRELENIMERALNLCENNVLTSKYLPNEIVDAQINPESSSMEESKKQHIINILSQTEWNISRAASKLNLSRPTLYRYIQKWNLNRISM